jgi:autotransporter-associated beta strand protein
MGANTYTGGTAINGGAVQVAADNNLGAATGPLSFNGGTLVTTASFTSGRATTINSGGGTFDVGPGTSLTMSSAIGGAGALRKSNAGTLVLAADNTYIGGTTISAGTLQLGAGATTGGIVGDVTDNGMLAFDRSDKLTFGGAISGSGAVSQIGSGTTILTADSPYTGGTTVNSGTLVVGNLVHSTAALSGGGPITVWSGATLGGYGSVTGPTVNNGVIAAGSATPGLIGSPTGDFTIIGNLLNHGAIQLASGLSIGNVLEVRGNYAGSGGSMAINTFLGGDGSPSDRLVISGGAASGNTSVHVSNVGGPGALTTANGIQVVSAVSGAMTSPGAFSLSNPELRAGAFDYALFRGGVSGSVNDWFLRSTFTGGGGGGGGSGGGGGGGIVPLPIPPFPIDPPPNPLPPGVEFPIIGPELATYGVVQPLARQLGLSILGTLDDRRGDTYEPDGCGVAAAAETSTVDLPTR